MITRATAGPGPPLSATGLRRERPLLRLPCAAAGVRSRRCRCPRLRWSVPSARADVSMGRVNRFAPRGLV